MLTDEELESLPTDPKQAFLEFQRRALEVTKAQGSDNFESRSFHEYYNAVLIAAKHFGIAAISSLPARTWASYGSRDYSMLDEALKNFSLEARLARASQFMLHSVELDGPTKVRIRHYIDRIKEIIDGVDIPDRKRWALSRRINDFLTELEKTRTNFEAFGEMFVDFCATVGSGIDKLEPARKWIDSIAGLLGQAKQLEDATRPQLNAPDELKQISGPE